jgi:hypothetical protein
LWRCLIPEKPFGTPPKPRENPHHSGLAATLRNGREL